MRKQSGKTIEYIIAGPYTGIYQILNTKNEKCYIGSAVNILRRLHVHRSLLRSGKHPNIYLQRAFDKFDGRNFEFRPLLLCDRYLLLFYEQRAINVYRDNGSVYNIASIAGSRLGVNHTKEARQKMSKARKGKYIGSFNPFYGKTHSVETKRKLSEFARTRKYSEKTKRRIAKTLKGHSGYWMNKKLSLSTRQKIAEALKGRKAWNVGLTKETDIRVMRMSESMKGRVPWNKECSYEKAVR